MINVYNLRKTYGDTEVLKGISLSLSNSEIVVLSGPSGCGKTTLLRTIAGFEEPDQGKILIDDMEVSTSNKIIIAPHKRKISMIFQDLALWPHMNVEKHIIFILKSQKLPKEVIKSKTDEILNIVKLDKYNKRYPSQLSGGERQRLAIARALASNVKYILMDEPFTNLDNILKNYLLSLFIRLKQNFNIGILYITHSVEDFFDISDRVAIMQDGIIIQCDKPDQLLKNPKNEFISQILKNKIMKI